jgi:hypothetical protein
MKNLHRHIGRKVSVDSYAGSFSGTLVRAEVEGITLDDPAVHVGETVRELGGELFISALSINTVQVV